MGVGVRFRSCVSSAGGGDARMSRGYRDPGLNYTEEGLVTTRMLVLVFGLILRMLALVTLLWCLLGLW